MISTASLSRKEIRDIAFKFRTLFGCQNELMFPVVEVLERIHLIDQDAHFEIVDSDEFDNPAAHGETDIANKCIKIRYDVYEKACAGSGRDRMTIAHELGHFVLIRLCGIQLFRTFDDSEVKPYNDPEWQAKCFAGELLIAEHLTNGMSEFDVVRNCGVSYEAARMQLSIQKKTKGAKPMETKKDFSELLQ